MWNSNRILQAELNFGHSHVPARVNGSKSITGTSTIGEFEGRWTISDRETARRQWKVVKRYRTANEWRSVSAPLNRFQCYFHSAWQATPFIIHRASRFVLAPATLTELICRQHFVRLRTRTLRACNADKSDDYYLWFRLRGIKAPSPFPMSAWSRPRGVW